MHQVERSDAYFFMVQHDLLNLIGSDSAYVALFES